MSFYVYIHTTPNKKRYVGVTTTRPEERWRKGNGYRRNKHFFSAIQKYGWENITHQVFKVSSREEMYRNEQELIELFKTNNRKYGYNNSIGGESGSHGCKLSEETKKKMSESQKGHIVSEETKKKMSESQKGKHISDETRKKMSETHKGMRLSEETRKKMSKSLVGKNQKPIIGIDGVKYQSVLECRKALGLCISVLYKKIKNGELKYA